MSFLAALPSIATAITLDGNGDGGMVKLIVDRENVGALLLLQQQYAETIFQVEIKKPPAE